MPGYIELHAHSHYSFLDAVTSPAALVQAAAERYYPAIALTDYNGIYGAIEFVTATERLGLKPIIGAEVAVGPVVPTNPNTDNSTAPIYRLVLLAKNSTGYTNLTQILTAIHSPSASGPIVRPQQPCLDPVLLRQYQEGLICLAGYAQGEVGARLLAGDHAGADQAASWYQCVFGDCFYLEIQQHLFRQDKCLSGILTDLATALHIPTVATNQVRYVAPEDGPVHDVLRCIGQQTTLDAAGLLLRRTSAQHLRTSEEMQELFAYDPMALRNAVAISERCEPFSLQWLDRSLPCAEVPPGEAADSYLRQLCLAGAHQRYDRIAQQVQDRLEHELRLIQRMQLADYFLLVADAVRWSRKQNIICQGRGSAATSLVAYLLGITLVDPLTHDLPVERFLNDGRQGYPDIDVDFPASDREQVIQYLFQRYGRDHAALVCEFSTYRAASSVRDVAKALGYSHQKAQQFADRLDSRASSTAEAGWTQIPRQVASLAQRLSGIPRHLATHPGGMVFTRRALPKQVPVQPAAMPNRTIIQWDKSSIEEWGAAKLDVLGLGMLGAIQDTIRLIQHHHGITLDPACLPQDDPRVYRTIRQSDTIGVFQVESRAQISMLPRLRPCTFHDLAVAVAIIRPGPIQGGVVQPYLRRRRGLEPISYPHPVVAPILQKTLGVPLFQEQGLLLTIHAAGFSAADADRARRIIARNWDSQEHTRLRDALFQGMEERGISGAAAQAIYEGITSFASYGFLESHAISFAHLVYLSAYLKRYFPAEFYVGILNNQPMGFYSPFTLIRDALNHGIPTLPPDINEGAVIWTAEYPPGSLAPRGVLRTGLGQVRGVGMQAQAVLAEEQIQGPFHSLRDFVVRTRLPKDVTEQLIRSGACSKFGVQRQLLWSLQDVLDTSKPQRLPLPPLTDGVLFPALTAKEHLVTELETLELSTEHHPLEFYRQALTNAGTLSCSEVREASRGQIVRVAGLVVVRQRPKTARGVVFIMLEDETGWLDSVVWPKLYDHYRRLLDTEALLVIEGVVQQEGPVVSLLARHFRSLPQWLVRQNPGRAILKKPDALPSARSWH